MRRITWVFILGILIVLVLVAVIFVYYATAVNNVKPDIKNPISENAGSEIIISEEYISYLLNEIGAYKLHNPPLSNDMPKINLKVDELEFKAEIDNGYPRTNKGNWDKADIKITTTKKEVTGAIKSNPKEYMKNSVSSGKTEIKLEAGYTELFSKGYLTLYHDLTGKSFTGSVIRIFAS